MGIYSNTRYDSLGNYNVDVAADESYNSTAGLGMALIETYQNDLALFEAAIHSDMAEIAAVNEGVEVINEGAKEIWNKLKEIFTKLLAKIKGIFKSFLARISGVFRDSKSLYDKYNKTISKNTNWKNFKAKYRKFKGGADIVEFIGQKASYTFKGEYAFIISGSGEVVPGITVARVYDKDSDIDTDDILTAISRQSLNQELASNISTVDEINKELMDLLFDDEETKDDWSTGDILHGCIGDLLKDASKSETSINKWNKHMEDTISKIITKINKESENVTKILSNKRLDKSPSEYTFQSVKVRGGDSTGKTKGSVEKGDYTRNGATYSTHDEAALENIERLAGFWQRYAGVEQSVINALTRARLGAYKFAITQARRIFSSAAAYASVDHKNEAYEYYTAIGEAVEYDTLSTLQSV